MSLKMNTISFDLYIIYFIIKSNKEKNFLIDFYVSKSVSESFYVSHKKLNQKMRIILVYCM